MSLKNERLWALCSIFGAALIALGVFLILGHRQGPLPPEEWRGEAPHFKNLILLVADALRSDHLPSYGYHRNTAPFLSRLAREGVQLQGYSTSSWTRTSVATLLTGLYPPRHQTTTRADRLPETVAYLPEVLQDNGFSCRGYTANPMVGPRWGFSRGYENYVSHMGDKHNKPRASEVGEAARRVAHGLNGRFFLYLHYLDTHDPYLPARAFETGNGAANAEIQPDDILKQRVPLDDRSIRAMENSYDGAILEMDREIEGLFEYFDRVGLLRDTLVVVTADHGEEFGEHGGVAHARTLHREVLQVPFVLWSPGMTRSRTSDRGFHQVDFLPTILDALGIETPENLDGRSRWLEMNQARDWEPAGNEYFALDLARHNAVALRSGDLKLIHREKQPTNRLYAIAADPQESKAVEGRNQDRDEMLHKLIGMHNRLSEQAVDRVTADIEGRDRRQLEALGYVEHSAQEVELRIRDIPDRLNYYGSRAYGLFAGLAPASLLTDLDLRMEPLHGRQSQRRPPQLLEGWLSKNRTGTWSRAKATFALPRRPGASGTLVMTGNMPRGRKRVTCRVAADGQLLDTFDIRPGSFSIQTSLPPAPAEGQITYFDLQVAPAMRLPSNGPLVGLQWSRITLR